MSEINIYLPNTLSGTQCKFCNVRSHLSLQQDSRELNIIFKKFSKDGDFVISCIVLASAKCLILYIQCKNVHNVKEIVVLC